MRHVDAIEINEKHPSNVNYAKGREAINADGQALYRDNVAGLTNYLKPRKEALVEILGGKVVYAPRGTYVEFPDKTKAKY